MSVDSAGTESNGWSNNASISSNGRFVAWDSTAGNIVENDTNDVDDIFVRDSKKGTTTRIAATGSAAEWNGHSRDPSISANGRFVTFTSFATNIVDGDTNDFWDIFVHDRKRGTTTRVSVSSSGAQSNGYSNVPVISGNGRFVAFVSDASNLVPGDENEQFDVFVYDLRKRTTTRVSVDSSGREVRDGGSRPALSRSGRFVVFNSWASNLVDADTNDRADVFLHDRKKRTTTRVSVSASGGSPNGDSTLPAISADGKKIVFMSHATDLVAEADTNEVMDVFVYDRRRRRTDRVSVGAQAQEADAGSWMPTISMNGRFVAFASRATNIVAGARGRILDSFVRDLKKGVTTRVSVDSAGVPANDDTLDVVLSGNGRFAAFVGPATNLVPDDTNGGYDVFVHDRK